MRKYIGPSVAGWGALSFLIMVWLQKSLAEPLDPATAAGAQAAMTVVFRALEPLLGALLRRLGIVVALFFVADCAGSQVPVQTDSLIQQCDPFAVNITTVPSDPPMTRVEIRCGDGFFILQGVEALKPADP